MVQIPPINCGIMMEQHKRLMDLPGRLCYSSMVTRGFMVSKSCCTYITRFREKHASVRWELNGFCGSVSCAELKGHIIKENMGKQLTQGFH